MDQAKQLFVASATRLNSPTQNDPIEGNASSMAPLQSPAWMCLASIWPWKSRNRRAPWMIEFAIIYAMLLLIAAATPLGWQLGAMSPTPLWIPVLLLSSQYGTAAGLSAAVAAMAVHWFACMPPQVGGEDIYDYLYRTWREPMLWPVAAIVLGGLRDRHAQETETLRNRLVDAEAHACVIGGHAETLRARCEDLERRMACADERSIEAGLSVLEEVRLSTRNELKRVLPRAMGLLVGPASYQVLTLRDGHLVSDVDLCCAPERTSRFPLIEGLPSLLEAELLRGRRLLSIRKSEAVHRLVGTALIAAPIPAPTGEHVIGALLIQTMDPKRLTECTERSVNALCHELARPLSGDRVLCNLALLRAPPRLDSGNAVVPLS